MRNLPRDELTQGLDVDSVTTSGPEPERNTLGWYNGSLERKAVCARVIHLLRQTKAAVAVPPPNPLSPLQRLVLSNPDFYLPQREHAPSRVAVKGPFSQIDMSSRSGLFSELVFRLIAFNTRALRETAPDTRTVIFEDIHAWDQYLAQLREIHGDREPKFFCDPNAFGRQWQGGRVVENASLYWETTSGGDWEKLFPNGAPAVFEECFAALENMSYQGPNDVTKKSPPLIRGVLSRYLICTDLVYAGAISIPSVDEIAAFIYSLNSGAVKGLRFLGYCPMEQLEDIACGGEGKALRPETKNPHKASPPTHEEVLMGFRNFYSDVDASLSPEEKNDMGWDVLMAEHTLCKISRLKKFWDSL